MDSYTTKFIRTTFYFTMLYLLLWTPFSRAFPASVNINAASTTGNEIHIAVGILRNVMFQVSDLNRNNKLSATEIESFYSRLYPLSVAHRYGVEFILIADSDHDGELNPGGKTRPVFKMSKAFVKRLRSGSRFSYCAC